MTNKDIIKAETAVTVKRGGLIQAKEPAPTEWQEEYGITLADKYAQQLAGIKYIYYTPSTVSDCLTVLDEERLMAVISAGWRQLRQNSATDYTKESSTSIDLGMTWLPYPTGVNRSVSRAQAKDKIIADLQAQVVTLTAQLTELLAHINTSKSGQNTGEI